MNNKELFLRDLIRGMKHRAKQALHKPELTPNEIYAEDYYDHEYEQILMVEVRLNRQKT